MGSAQKDTLTDHNVQKDPTAVDTHMWTHLQVQSDTQVHRQVKIGQINKSSTHARAHVTQVQTDRRQTISHTERQIDWLTALGEHEDFLRCTACSIRKLTILDKYMWVVCKPEFRPSIENHAGTRGAGACRSWRQCRTTVHGREYSVRMALTD